MFFLLIKRGDSYKICCDLGGGSEKITLSKRNPLPPPPHPPVVYIMNAALCTYFLVALSVETHGMFTLFPPKQRKFTV